MVRDRQHGPVVELNRIQVNQMCAVEHLFHNLSLFFFFLMFSPSFAGEGVFRTCDLSSGDFSVLRV